MKRYGVLQLTLVPLVLFMHQVQSDPDPSPVILTSKIEKIMADSAIPGAAAIIVKSDGLVWWKTFGLADRDSGNPVDDHTIFRIGSITKMFTGLAALIAQEEGLFMLDDRIKPLMPDFHYSNRWEKTHPLKVAHLLEHTSGLPGLTPEEFNLDHPIPLNEAIMWKAGIRQTRWPPGMHRAYSNAGPGYAAYLLEHVTGEAYEEFVEKKIFTPLGMNSASFFPDEQTMKYLATGYDSDGYRVIPYWHMFYRAFGAINIRPHEMAPFIQLLLNNGVYQGNRILSTKSVERMETPMTTLAARSGLKYGYGIGNYTFLRKGNLFHGHGGDGDGYLARLGYSRDLNNGYFLVINAFNNRALSRFRHCIEDYLIGDRRPPEPPVPTLPTEDLEKFTGTYEKIAQRFHPQDESRENEQVRVIIEGGILFMVSGDKESELIPVNNIHFRYSGETAATAAFVYDENNRLYFQDENNNYRKIADSN